MLDYNPIKVKKYKDYNILQEDVRIEEETTSYIPIPLYINFSDDKYINDKWTFNENGLKSLCQYTDIYGLFSAMNASEEPELASIYLNKIMLQENIKKKLENKRFVVSGNEVIGVVGSRYTPYSNRQFLEDLPTDNMEMTRAVISNSKMTVSFTELFKGFFLRGGTDKTEIGQTFKSSHTGDSSFKSSIWSLRTKCTNGMMHRSDISNMRANHTGGYDNMKSRLDNIVELARDQYEVVKERIETLLSIPYTNYTADRLLQHNAPINIIPDLKEKKLWNKSKKFKTPEDSVNDLKRSISIVDDIPQKYGGIHTHEIWNSSYRNKRSIYDFVEAFTEHAQTCDPQTQIEIEEDAGHLTSWIAKHKEKLLN